MIKILIFFAAFAVLPAFGQNNNFDENDSKSNEYLKLIYNDCPHPDIIEVEYSEDGYYEVNYLCGEQLYEIGISNNSIIFKEMKIDISDAPMEQIQKKIDKKHKDWILDEIAQITAGDETFFKVEILKDGLEQNLYFTDDGKWYKPKSGYSTDKININSLSETEAFQESTYNFLSPDYTYEMPDLLREISGVAITEENTFFCVQDEIGAVFEYSPVDEKIINIHRFTDIGDFEDIAIHGDTVSVLRSDGNTFVFDYQNKGDVRQHIFSVNSLNIESLFFSGKSNSFYVVSKDVNIGMEDSERIVYSFPTGMLHSPDTAFILDAKFLNKHLKTNYPELINKDMQFAPSAIAVHPINADIYVLSASDRILAVFSDGILKSAYPLPAEMYYKPEGLAFYANGDLLISNEGDKKGLFQGNILKFKFR